MKDWRGVEFFIEKGRAPVVPDWDASMRQYFISVLTELFLFEVTNDAG